MNVVTITFGIIVLACAWRGYRKGFLRSIAGLAALLVAYPAAIFFTKPFAAFLTQATGLEGMLVYFIAGFLIFMTVSMLVGLLLNRPTPPQEITLDSGETLTVSPDVTTASRVCGAAAGLVIGSAAGLLAVYMISVFQQQPGTSASMATSSSERAFLETSARRLASTVAATAADFVFDDPTTTALAKSFVDDPRAMLVHVQGVMDNSEQVAAVMSNEQIKSLVATGDVEGLMRVPDFQALVNDEHMQALLPSGGSSEETAQATAETLVSTWGRMNQVTNDPEFMALMADPELQKKLQERDMSLMTDPRLTQLAEIIFASDKPAE